MKKRQNYQTQSGAVSLYVAIMILIGITLITLLTSKTILMETKITADNYRINQATAAAQAAMDQGVAYYMAGGLDQNGNGTVDYSGPGVEPTVASCAAPTTTLDSTPLNLTLPQTPVTGEQTTYAQFYFDNSVGNLCGASGNMTEGMITAKGWSDDCVATRTITQCLGTFDLFDNGESPQQPFVSKAGVGVFGNAKIINRYSYISIWAGGADSVHGASYGTYLRPSGTEVGDYTLEELDSSCEASPCNVAGNPGPNTLLVSNRDSGNGVDVITDDPTLANKTTSLVNLTDPAQNQFFDLFFARTKAEIKNIAQDAGQMYDTSVSTPDLDGKTGLVWVEGDVNINGTDVLGTPTNPVILIINGNLDKLNGATIYGVVYVTGTLEIAGNPIVKGSIVAENPTASFGAGTLTLVFKPWGDSGNGASNPFIIGTGAVIAGSWRDW